MTRLRRRVEGGDGRKRDADRGKVEDVVREDRDDGQDQDDPGGSSSHEHQRPEADREKVGARARCARVLQISGDRHRHGERYPEREADLDQARIGSLCPVSRGGGGGWLGHTPSVGTVRRQDCRVQAMSDVAPERHHRRSETDVVARRAS